MLITAGSLAFAADAPPKPNPPRQLQVCISKGAPRWEYRSHRLLLDRGSEKVKPFNYRVILQIPIRSF